MTYGLIGEKLGHSFSGEIHAKIGNYPYELIELAPDEVERFFAGKAFSAINVTIPYKEKVMAYLDEISPQALAIGAVNTVVQKNGKLYGYNTDYFGAMAMLNNAGIAVSDKKVVILGTGGTAKTLTAVCRDMGAKQILHVSRRKTPTTVTYEELLSEHTDAEVLINTTPVGMYPNSQDMPVDIAHLPLLEGVADVIYNPLATKLVQSAEKRGITACGGLYMLAAQAVYGSALFFDKAVDPAQTERVYRSVLKEKQNIVLVGMPSSGKSTVGKAVAKILSRPFFDSDSEIVKKAGKAIPAIFEEEGEAAFRQIEREVLADLSKHSGAVIATGGGAVLSPENMENLRQNGVIFFLDRSLEKLTPTKNRPLSQNGEALKQRYLERYPIYRAVAHKTVDANGRVQQVAHQLIKEFTR